MTEGDNHRAILACTPNATLPPATLKTVHKNNHKQLVCLTSSIRRVSCRTQTTLFEIYLTRCRDKRRHCSNQRVAPDTGSAGMTTPRRATGVLTATDSAERLLSSKVYERSTTDENVLSGMQFYLYFTVCESRVIGTYDKSTDHTIYTLSIFDRVIIIIFTFLEASEAKKMSKILPLGTFVKCLKCTSHWRCQIYWKRGSSINSCN